VIDPGIIALFIAGLWLIVAAVVIGYPLVAGRIRAGAGTFSREDDPRAFWRAYLFSTALFVAVSVAAGFLVHAIFRLNH